MNERNELGDIADRGLQNTSENVSDKGLLFAKDYSDIAKAEKDALLAENNDDGIDIGGIFLAYAIVFVALLIFMPKIYLANNIYYASKNIHYLQAQKESLKNENLLLQQKLESAKFNFLTLEIDEIE